MGFVPRGIIPPIITPLTDDGEVNYPVLRQMVNHLIAPLYYVYILKMYCNNITST